LSNVGRAFDVWPQAPTEAISEVAVTVTPRSSRAVWIRRGLAGLWTLLFVTAGVGVTANWDRLVAGLVRAPMPVDIAAAAPTPSSAERAVKDARRLLDAGHPAEALAALDGLKPEEPAYPFSLQLREEADRALARGGSKLR
jgi:hypothetical protein